MTYRTTNYNEPDLDEQFRLQLRARLAERKKRLENPEPNEEKAKEEEPPKCGRWR